jgi:hypothetical protein
LDKVTARQYAQDLEENLLDLHGRMRSGSYKAPPVVRVWLEEEGGKKGPTGKPTVCATTTEPLRQYLHAQVEPGAIGSVVAVAKALSTGRNLTDCALATHFPGPESSTISRACRAAKAMRHSGSPEWSSVRSKRAETEEPDEGNLHVRVCGGAPGNRCFYPEMFSQYQKPNEIVSPVRLQW